MSLTVSEAQAVNTALRYWLHIGDDDYHPEQQGSISDDEARDAMEFLARRAHARLGAGIRPDQVVETWANRQRF